MSETITLARVARATARLNHAFQLGQSAERPGIITAAHTATWHMAGLVEHLRSSREDQVERLRRGELSAGPVRPDEEPTT